MVAADVEERLSRLEAEAAIRDLCSAFCQALDHRDESLFLSIWADDAEWLIGTELQRGTDEIRAAWKSSIDSVKRSRHIAANVLVTWHDDHATARSELYGQATMADGSPNQVIVTMDDELVKQGERWVIRRRVVDLPG